MTVVPSALAGRLGRFELLREIGRGAQATVWLAHDPQLDREVALKCFHVEHAQPVAQWLHEARTVSRLTHANIVPVFDAGDGDGRPYLVFEYVAGQTLSQWRRGRPRMASRDAAALMLGILDALAAAHAQAIVHRDLKPSNVLLGADGRPRVMDFGIAARVARGDGRVVGTPGYISPEAARGEPPIAAMDVFAAGVMLGELIAGEPLLRESDPWRAVQRVQREDLSLPAGLVVDDGLRGIVQRALARDATMRYDSARAMHDALSAWLRPVETPVLDAGAGATHSTLDFLLRRMRRRSDFPALSDSVARVLRMSGSETESLNRLSEEILKDVGLTHKLLRLVNAAHYTAAAGGGIGTVSRAVALVGIAGIRNLVLSALLLEHMGDKGHAKRLQHEFLRAMTAATLARELAPLARESEDAFLAAMFQNLGRLLTEYYFPDEAVQIRDQVDEIDADTTDALDASARQVLGIGYGELTAGVALAWGLPGDLRRALRRPETESPLPAATMTSVERLRWLAHGANELTDALLIVDGDDAAQALAAAAGRPAAMLGRSVADIVATAQSARVQMRQMARAMGLSHDDGPARRLLGATPPAAAAEIRPAVEASSADAPTLRLVTAQAVLETGLAAVRAAVASRSMRLNELLFLVIETMQQGLDLQRVVLCLREPRSGQLTGRVGLGADGALASAAFRIPVAAAGTADLFAAVCARGADVLIADAAAVASRLPAWYRQRVDAPTFVLLPLLHRGVTIGLIYGDKPVAASLQPSANELSLMRALRDEAAAAFGRT